MGDSKGTWAVWRRAGLLAVGAVTVLLGIAALGELSAARSRLAGLAASGIVERTAAARAHETAALEAALFRLYRTDDEPGARAAHAEIEAHLAALAAAGADDGVLAVLGQSVRAGADALRELVIERARARADASRARRRALALALRPELGQAGGEAWARALSEVARRLPAAGDSNEEAELERLEAECAPALRAAVEGREAAAGTRAEALIREAVALVQSEAGVFASRRRVIARDREAAEAWDEVRQAALRLAAEGGRRRVAAEADIARQAEEGAAQAANAERLVAALSAAALLGWAVLFAAGRPSRPASPTAAVVEAQAEPPGALPLAGKTAMVVEGNAALRGGLVRALQADGATVTDGESVGEALELADLAAPDVLVLGTAYAEGDAWTRAGTFLEALRGASLPLPPTLVFLDAGEVAAAPALGAGVRVLGLAWPFAWTGLGARLAALAASAPLPAAPVVPPILDLEHVRATFGGLDRGAVDMLGYFLETTGPSLDGIVAALAAGDLARVRELAHQAAGAARTAGAKPLAEACSGLERVALAGDRAAAVALAPALGPAFAEVKAAIAALGRRISSGAMGPRDAG